MDNKKGYIGFATRARETQDTFDKIQQKLEKTTTAWDELRDFAGINKDAAKKVFEDKLKAAKSATDIALSALMLDHWNLLLSVAEVGKAVIDTQKRLAEIEKNIDTLSLRIK